MPAPERPSAADSRGDEEEAAVLTTAARQTRHATAAAGERVHQVLQQQQQQQDAATTEAEKATLEAKMRATTAALQQRATGARQGVAAAYQSVTEALASPLPVRPEEAAAAVTAATGATYYKYKVPAGDAAEGENRSPSFNPDNYPVRLYNGHGSGADRRPWHYSLCTLLSHTDSCLEACCCSTCQLARQYNMLEHLQPSPHVPLLLMLLAGRLCGYSLPGLVALFVVRKEIRGRYGIEGSACMDALTVCCCSTCAVQQQLLEMSSLAAFPGAFCYHEGPAMERQML